MAAEKPTKDDTKKADPDAELAAFYEAHPEAADKWLDDGVVMGFLGVTGEKKETTTNEVANPEGEGGGPDPDPEANPDPEPGDPPAG